MTAPNLVVGVGLTAASVHSLRTLVARLSLDCKVALVGVWLEPDSDPGELLSQISAGCVFPVIELQQEQPVDANRIYVTPAGHSVECREGRLCIEKMAAPTKLVERLFQSLAAQFGQAVAGVVLAGAEAIDSVEGLVAVRTAGGVAFAEDSGDYYSDLPTYSRSHGNVDFVLSAEAIGDEICVLARHPYLRKTHPEEKVAPPDEFLARIFALLRQQTGVDFALYKPSTVGRRIMRRMLLQRFENLEQFYQLLRQSQEAVDTLYQDLLITVTGLFRDPEVYQFLAERVLPSILDQIEPDQPIRIWVPGCSKGDEVYSIAIVLLEVMAERHVHHAIQIFATDVNERALERARAGIYPDSLAEEVAPERLRRYFQKLDRGYQISKHVRDLCVFARQDLTRDPPFSRLDLISCRNLLIYLNTTLQYKILGIFHYALKPSGYLILGASESIGRASEFFVQVERLLRIFSRRATPAPLPLEPFEAVSALIPPRPEEHQMPVRSLPVTSSNASEIHKEADRLTLARFAPPGVLINADFEVLQFRGRTGLFFEHPPGTVTYNILKLAREGLLADLRSALQEVAESNKIALREGVRMLSNGDWTVLDLEVIPLALPGGRDRFMLVLFKPVGSSPTVIRSGEFDDQLHSEMLHLRQELEATREYLNSVNQEQEATLERLQAANEEVQSANEELQSTNEELETAKEELQSTNEELTTVNEELHERNLQLTRVNNDLTNLLSSVNIPVVILGPDLRIRRFTPMARQILNVIPSDIGRPIGDLRPHLEIPDLERRIQEVLDTLCPQQLELQDREGRWFSVRMRPYRTTENRIDGAVIVFVDVDQPRRSLEEAQEARNLTRAMLEISDRPSVLLDEDLQIKEANSLFFQLLGLVPEQLLNRPLQDLDGGRYHSDKLRGAVDRLKRSKGGEQGNIDLAWRARDKSMVRVRLRLAQQSPAPIFALCVDDRKPRVR
ncbi:MAG: CheR family methyltransferase [Vulcanimicrobiota bacterium]